MNSSPFQITIRRSLFAIFWFGVCLAMVRAWWQSSDEFLFLVYAGIAFCISLGTVFKKPAVGAFVGFILVTACLIVANVVAMVRLL